MIFTLVKVERFYMKHIKHLQCNRVYIIVGRFMKDSENLKNKTNSLQQKVSVVKKKHFQPKLQLKIYFIHLIIHIFPSNVQLHYFFSAKKQMHCIGRQ